jgi:hypothetical protein
VCLVSRETVEKGSATHCRFFAPHFGIPEDIVTGSVHSSIGVWLLDAGLLHADGALAAFTAEQGDGLGRPGRLSVELQVRAGAVTRVRVGGSAVTVLSGNRAAGVRFSASTSPGKTAVFGRGSWAAAIPPPPGSCPTRSPPRGRTELDCPRRITAPPWASTPLLGPRAARRRQQLSSALDAPRVTHSPPSYPGLAAFTRALLADYALDSFGPGWPPTSRCPVIREVYPNALQVLLFGLDRRPGLTIIKYKQRRFAQKRAWVERGLGPFVERCVETIGGRYVVTSDPAW